MKPVRHLPVNDSTNGWSRILPPRTPKPVLDGDIRAHTVVVGAGYAGLAAARRMAENRPDERVVLLEAHKVGENASGRNSGFAIDLPHVISSSMDELESAHRHMSLSRAAIAYHEEQISRHGIECDWSQQGKYQTAVTDRGAETYLMPFMQELDKLEEPYTWIEGRELDSVLGTGHFRAAVYTPGCRLLNPAALVRGLADTLPENVVLHEHAPVTGIDCSGGIHLKTEAGSVRAERMVLGVNAFARYFGFYARNILPFAANASLTRRLTPAEQEALGCKGEWGVTPANAFASITMRYTRDHRILIRQNIYFNRLMRESQSYQDRIAKHHKRLFDERFPMLPEVDMEYTWTGYLALSQNGAPGFGRVAENVYSCVCQNAIGVTKGTIGGMLAADMACGEDNELIGYMQSLGQPSVLPPSPFLDIGVRAKLLWETWSARDEV
ncbi:MAG: FAD-binding oxidoreductase [Gammaproteobacteria bacterium]|nr:FAD-binding oxidoreductase [Gammaproteobacteria bacterium]MYD77057.1 FAD-binding oxidoreductase [Gammaproteobacteria bacterium]MYJ53106.1 FAD-binding oxidoreductase [Gammaproteobacteria bacterium]